MPYTNQPVITSTTGLWSTQNGISFNTISTIPNIPFTAQLEVERIFSADRSGSTAVVTNFLTDINIKQSDKRAVFIIPNSRLTINNNTKTITNIDLPSSGNVYDFLYYRLDTPNTPSYIQVPAIANNANITIRRQTVSNIPLVSWVAGSKLTSSQLNLQTTQLLYLAQELFDRVFVLTTTSYSLVYNLANNTVNTNQIVAGAVTPDKLTTTAVPWVFNGTLQTLAPTADLHATTRLYSLGKFFYHGVMTKDDVAPTSSAVDILETSPTSGQSGLWFNPKTGKLSVWAGNTWVAVAGTPVTAVNLVSTDTTQTITGAKTFSSITAPVTNLTYTASGAGAVSRTLPSKLGEVVSVKDFGAVGDGVADDTAAIQAAITAAANKALYFPAGTYVATALTVSSPCRLFGDGILKKTTAANAAFLTISSSDVVIDGLEFRGASFDTTPATMVFLDTAIKMYGANSTNPYRRFNISNVKVNGFAGFAMDIRWSEDVTITGCQIKYCGYAGILFESVVRGIIANNRISWIDSNAGAINWYGISLSRDPTMTATASVPTQEVTVVGNVITDVPKWTGIDTHASLNCEIVGNVVARCKNGMYAQYDSASATYRMPARNTRFDSNIVIGRTTESENEIGIASLGSVSVGARNDNIIIENNIVIGAGNWSGGNGALCLSYSDNSIVRNNTVYKAIGCGIAMVTQCNRCIVDNNVVNGVFGPRLSGASANWALIDNNATPSTKCVFSNNRLINTTGSDDYKVLVGIAYSHAGTTDVVFSRNRIDIANAMKGYSVGDPTRRVVDQLLNGNTPNTYTDLKWELETESCAPFTHTAVGGASAEATASQIANFRRTPATGWTTASTIARTRVSYKPTGSTYKIGVRPNEGNAYTVGVYTVDGSNITASTAITDIYITIEGIYWED